MSEFSQAKPVAHCAGNFVETTVASVVSNARGQPATFIVHYLVPKENEFEFCPGSIAWTTQER